MNPHAGYECATCKSFHDSKKAAIQCCVRYVWRCRSCGSHYEKLQEAEVCCQDDILEIRLSGLDLSARASQACRALNLLTINDLSNTRKCELLSIRLIGRSTVQELRLILESFGLTFKE